MEVVIKGKKILRQPLLAGCGQLCLFPIKVQDSLRTNLYLCFLHGDDHQGKVAYKTTAMVWAGGPLVQSTSTILSSISQEVICLLKYCQHWWSLFSWFFMVLVYKKKGCTYRDIIKNYCVFRLFNRDQLFHIMISTLLLVRLHFATPANTF